MAKSGVSELGVRARLRCEAARSAHHAWYRNDAAPAPSQASRRLAASVSTVLSLQLSPDRPEPNKSRPEHPLRRGLQNRNVSWITGTNRSCAPRSALRRGAGRAAPALRGERVSRTAEKTARLFLRSFCGPQCREQPGTGENSRLCSSVCVDIPASSRLFPVLKFIGEVDAILLPAGGGKGACADSRAGAVYPGAGRAVARPQSCLALPDA
jgi:hypothetical protein